MIVMFNSFSFISGLYITCGTVRFVPMCGLSKVLQGGRGGGEEHLLPPGYK